MFDEILTVKEVARILKMSEGCVRQMVFHKKIPYTKVVGRVRFEKSKIWEHFGFSLTKKET